LICTSGSAVLNHAPAVAEAFYRRIPLLVLSADRPEEWVDQGEGQTIRQRGALSAHVRYEGQLPRSVQDDLARHHADRLVQEALEACTGMPNGPVHLNVPFTEPLYGTSPGALPEPHQRIPTLVERLLPEEVLTN
ncbi:MAG: 2-succinyl-5-enolpyruvyl-6-hydroxy-3-cyclohexene-1-carboxylate synthase, partial [Flavobacteriales bacterium]|nr:2-succinyl-5-enolpyruvyl-6-hydroxy-3-cyclohexene-1-carboxylate synthase [Flavobacteriales bacterium]